MTLQQAADWIPVSRLYGSGQLPIARVHTDTRTVEPGDLFVALQGDRYDANAFLADAQERGAVAVVCRSGLDASRLPSGLARIEVQDTKAALQHLAVAWRAQFDIPVISVTGSNGKTTVTQMIASILEAQFPNEGSLATRGNFNNDIGVPLTLLRLRSTHRMAVVEMGMNHPGEIATLAAMVRPRVSLVNNAQREHLEFMHSVAAVAEENGAAICALDPSGVAVFPVDDEFSVLWHKLAHGRTVIQFGMKPVEHGHMLYCKQTHWSQGGWQVTAQGKDVTLNYRLAIAGLHNVKNSLAAAACAIAAGVTANAIEAGLQNFVPVKGRSRAHEIAVRGHACTLVDDTYNANPDSVRAAIDVLADLPGPRMLVLGDMGEVGHEGPAFHAEAGRYAFAKGIEQLLAIGELSQSATDVFPGARHFDSVQGLNDAVLADLPRARSLLVKGSRFMRMERVVEAIMAHSSNGVL